MAQQRYLHARLGHSTKVAGLADFDYRVWTQYLLSADDFGVVRASAVTLQADNDYLATVDPEMVQAAIELLIAVDLVQAFAHQGWRYLYQRDWWDWQCIGYPSQTLNPAPDAEALATCSDLTRAFFHQHPGGFRSGKEKATRTSLLRSLSPVTVTTTVTTTVTVPESSGNLPGTLLEHSGNLPGIPSPCPVAPESPSLDPPAHLVSGLQRLKAVYPKWQNEAGVWAILQAMAPSPATLDAMVTAAERYARKVADWQPRYIKSPKNWLSERGWLDDDVPTLTRPAPVSTVPDAEATAKYLASLVPGRA